MLAYAALMRADYSDMISNVESTQSYSLDRIEPSQLKDRPPVNHNLITMPGWRATYPVGFDTYPHLHTTSQAADSLRLKRDRDVKSYLIASR